MIYQFMDNWNRYRVGHIVKVEINEVGDYKVNLTLDYLFKLPTILSSDEFSRLVDRGTLIRIIQEVKE